MKVVIQRVREAKVIVDDKTVGAIQQGYMLLVGIEDGDGDQDIRKAADKIAEMRLFNDEDDKINLSIKDVGGAILSVSQFTLAGNVRKGNRPSFINAMRPEAANEAFERFNAHLRNHGLHVETGIFQTHMNVILDNDGPTTLILEVKDGKVQ
ncbi:D-tyrosyl-tRNA(Tyr) deacylase [Erysipelothrix sp. HDW6C]|uniref:D-aminoacyl-tRNA deacylase n=1 Tax=Erysipelothrix sp. HDW6C TaxID=2714930 RepID=UPI00140726D2|nr:D-aminoacyl-tRNA deacylase [Erysipelothrix sp. HDW6C]QIK69013.1 D-tyrosyl-tRNA(Tyr) deacylase [Erysipelothrix sp. HDW6C]